MRKVICLMGIDGGGKTTLLNEASKEISFEALTWKHFEDLFYMPWHHPNSIPTNTLRKLSNDGRGAILFSLFALQQDLFILRNERNVPLIIDSYWYKWAAKMKLSHAANEWFFTALEGLVKPDHVIFLDTPPECAKERKKNDINYYECDGNPDTFIDHQHRIRELMLNFVSGIPMSRIDGSLPSQEVYSCFQNHLTTICAAPRQKIGA